MESVLLFDYVKLDHKLWSWEIHRLIFTVLPFSLQFLCDIFIVPLWHASSIITMNIWFEGHHEGTENSLLFMKNCCNRTKSDHSVLMTNYDSSSNKADGVIRKHVKWIFFTHISQIISILAVGSENSKSLQKTFACHVIFVTFKRLFTK